LLEIPGPPPSQRGHRASVRRDLSASTPARPLLAVCPSRASPGLMICSPCLPLPLLLLLFPIKSRQPHPTMMPPNQMQMGQPQVAVSQRLPSTCCMRATARTKPAAPSCPLCVPSSSPRGGCLWRRRRRRRGAAALPVEEVWSVHFRVRVRVCVSTSGFVGLRVSVWPTTPTHQPHPPTRTHQPPLFPRTHTNPRLGDPKIETVANQKCTPPNPNSCSKARSRTLVQDR